MPEIVPRRSSVRSTRGKAPLRYRVGEPARPSTTSPGPGRSPSPSPGLSQAIPTAGPATPWLGHQSRPGVSTSSTPPGLATPPRPTVLAFTPPVRPDMLPTLAESDPSGGEESEDEWWPPGNLSSRGGVQIGRVGGGDVDTDSDEDRVYSELVDGPGIASGRTIRRPKWAS